jgi:O-acetyl-ADP-ribose deacetylase (regulator of RNase III)
MKEIKGNIIEALKKGAIYAVGHVANAQKTMGSGVALALRKEWPQVYGVDANYMDPPANRMGNITVANVGVDRYVFNLYAQLQYGQGIRHLNYEALYQALEKMKDQCLCLPVPQYKVGFPKLMGSDRAGGRWRIVETMIDEVFNGMDVTIVDFNE